MDKEIGGKRWAREGYMDTRFAGRNYVLLLPGSELYNTHTRPAVDVLTHKTERHYGFERGGDVQAWTVDDL